jgi:hypothetical protein
MLQTSLIWRRYECPKFWNSKSPNFGEKMPLDVAPLESHKVYYKEGSNASSQKLQVV